MNQPIAPPATTSAEPHIQTTASTIPSNTPQIPITQPTIPHPPMKRKLYDDPPVLEPASEQVFYSYKKPRRNLDEPPLLEPESNQLRSPYKKARTNWEVPNDE